MEEKLLYLLGAGASHERVPLVSSIGIMLEKFVFVLDWMKKILESGRSTRSRDAGSGPLEKEAELITELLDKARRLSRNSNNHATIDTYAKKLFFQGQHGELDDMKAVFAIFLLFIQAQTRTYTNDPNLNLAISAEMAVPDGDFISDTPVDKRYDAWLASLMRIGKFDLPEGSRQIPFLPQSVKVVSWNYDIQLERAYLGFVGDQRMVGFQMRDPRNLLQVNGSCLFDGLLDQGQTALLDGIFSCGGFGVYDTIRLYAETKKQIARPRIQFAWESETKKRLGLLSPFSDSTILVIIGYSFPYFNREIDVEIFSQLIKLKRIYIQAPEADLPGINQRLDSVLSLRRDRNGRGMEPFSSVEWVKDLGTFYIPNEF